MKHFIRVCMCVNIYIIIYLFHIFHNFLISKYFTSHYTLRFFHTKTIYDLNRQCQLFFVDYYRKSIFRSHFNFLQFHNVKAVRLIYVAFALQLTTKWKKAHRSFRRETAIIRCRRICRRKFGNARVHRINIASRFVRRTD